VSNSNNESISLCCTCLFSRPNPSLHPPVSLQMMDAHSGEIQILLKLKMIQIIDDAGIEEPKFWYCTEKERDRVFRWLMKVEEEYEEADGPAPPIPPRNPLRIMTRPDISAEQQTKKVPQKMYRRISYQLNSSVQNFLRKPYQSCKDQSHMEPQSPEHIVRAAPQRLSRSLLQNGEMHESFTSEVSHTSESKYAKINHCKEQSWQQSAYQQTPSSMMRLGAPSSSQILFSLSQTPRHSQLPRSKRWREAKCEAEAKSL
jgi:hypothetical protein